MSFGIGGGTSNSSTNANQNVLSNGTTSGGTSGVSSRIKTPFQQSLESPLMQVIKNMMTNPSQIVKPLVDEAKQGITERYATAPQAIRNQFMAYGGSGKSGKYGTAALQSNLGRMGELSRADTAGAVTAAGMPMQGAGLATNLYGMTEGQSTQNDFNTQSRQQQNSTSNSDTSGNHFDAGLSI